MVKRSLFQDLRVAVLLLPGSTVSLLAHQTVPCAVCVGGWAIWSGSILRFQGQGFHRYGISWTNRVPTGTRPSHSGRSSFGWNLNKETWSQVSWMCYSSWLDILFNCMPMPRHPLIIYMNTSWRGPILCYHLVFFIRQHKNKFQVVSIIMLKAPFEQRSFACFTFMVSNIVTGKCTPLHCDFHNPSHASAKERGLMLQ